MKKNNKMVDPHHKIKQKYDYLVQVDGVQVVFHKQYHRPEDFDIDLQLKKQDHADVNREPSLGLKYKDKASLIIADLEFPDDFTQIIKPRPLLIYMCCFVFFGCVCETNRFTSFIKKIKKIVRIR